MRMRINNGYKVCVCSKLWGLASFFLKKLILLIRETYYIV